MIAVRIKKSLGADQAHPEVMHVLGLAIQSEMLPTRFGSGAVGRKMFTAQVQRTVIDLLQTLASGLHIDVQVSAAPAIHKGIATTEAWVYLRVWTSDGKAATLAYIGECT